MERNYRLNEIFLSKKINKYDLIYIYDVDIPSYILLFLNCYENVDIKISEFIIWKFKQVHVF